MPRRTIISTPDVSSEDEAPAPTPVPEPKKTTKKEQGPVMRTTRSEASRIATGSKPGTRTTVQRQPTEPIPKSVAVKAAAKAIAKPKATSATAKTLSTVAAKNLLKSPAKRGHSKKSSRKIVENEDNEDMSNRDVKQEEEGEGNRQETLVLLEVENSNDWIKTSSKRPAHDGWLFPSLLKRAKAGGKQSTAKSPNFADEPAIEHVLRAHSRHTHEGQDEDDVDTWAVAFQPTLPVRRHALSGAEEPADETESEDEDEGDDDNDENIRIRRRNKRIAKELSQQPPRSSSIVATCGGNTVCLIDCRLGKVMAKYSHVEEEEFMALAWTTLDHDQDLKEEDDDTPKEGQTNILAAAGRLGSIKLINPLQNNCYKYLHGHTDSVVRLKFSLTNPRWLFSASTDGSVRLWDIGSLTGFETEARCLAEFTRPDDSTSVTAIGVSEKYLIVGTDQGTMAQYNLFDLNRKLESEQGVRSRKVVPERTYPVSQEWHESSVDDIIYVPNFSEKSYSALQAELKTGSKTAKKLTAKRGKGARGRGGRGGRGRGRGGRSRANRGSSNSSDDSSDDDSDVDSEAEGLDDNDGEFVFASRESCQGEFIVWDASKSTATDAALKTILEWSITESWSKFTLVENRVTNLSLRKSLSSSSSPSSKSVGGKKKVEKMDWLEQRQSLLAAGMANGGIAIYDLSRPPKRASDGNIIACRPDRIISNGVSSELLRDIAVSEDLSMIVGGDWANKVVLWGRNDHGSVSYTAAQ